MRLIDADKLKEKLTSVEILQYIENGIVQETYDGTTAMDIIDEQPTAYDVDKAVEQLEKRKDDNIRYAKLPGNTDYKKIGHICRSDEDSYAIRVVKGGLEE